MRKTSTKEILAVVLFAGLAVVVYTQYARGAFSGRPRVAAERSVAKQIEASSLPALSEVTLSQKSEVKIRENSRNLFNYAKSPDQVAEERRQVEDAERQAREAAERRRLQAEADAKAAIERARYEKDHPPVPPAPPINFRFIGKMGSIKSPVAILEEAAPGGDKYLVKEGEVILDRYKVLKIEFDSVTIGYVNPLYAQETKTIKMGS